MHTTNHGGGGLNTGVAPLQEAISDIVLAQMAPLSEFELIKTLQQPPYELLSKQALQGTLDLFQTHFLVFHCLYRLRDEWQHSGLGWLRIEPLAIQLLSLDSLTGNTPYAEGLNLVREDPLTDYYLDLSNWTNTSALDVEQLLDSFWQRFTGSTDAGSSALSLTKVTAAQRSEALVVMDLAAMPVNLIQLKRDFRRQLHQCHPDKGGSNQAVLELQRAYQVLRQALQCGVMDA